MGGLQQSTGFREGLILTAAAEAAEIPGAASAPQCGVGSLITNLES